MSRAFCSGDCPGSSFVGDERRIIAPLFDHLVRFARLDLLGLALNSLALVRDCFLVVVGDGVEGGPQRRIPQRVAVFFWQSREPHVPLGGCLRKGTVVRQPVPPLAAPYQPLGLDQ